MLPCLVWSHFEQYLPLILVKKNRSKNVAGNKSDVGGNMGLTLKGMFVKCNNCARTLAETFLI